MLSALVAVVALLAVGGPPAVTIPAEKHAGPNAAAVAISADGARVAAGYGGDWTGYQPLRDPSGGVAVWDRQTGQQLYSTKQIGDILRVEFSKDGRYLAYNWIYTPGDSVHANQVVLVDLQTGEAIQKWESESFAFSPTDNLVLVGQRDGIDVVSLPSLEKVRQLPVSYPRCIAVSSDGQRVAALGAYWQDRRGTPDGLYVVALDGSGEPWVRHGEQLGKAQSLAISADGRSVATGHDGGEVRIWNTTDASAPPRLLAVDTPLALFPLFWSDGSSLAIFTQPVNGATWDYRQVDSAVVPVKEGESPPWAEGYIHDLSVGPAGVIHWRLEDASYVTHYARFQTTRGHPEVNSRRYVLSPDGRTLIASCNGCTLIDVATGRIERSFARKE
ncbi:MAG: WD40 repeat domain-containing protein [Pirellulales bacterium]